MAEPSRATWNSMTPDQPRECKACGETLRMTRDPAMWFDTMRKESWHHDCKLAAMTTNAADRAGP